jgi:HEPN domain-containing protein
MLENTQKWFDIAKEDLDMANISFQHGRYLHMMFFSQQALEKVLKGFYLEQFQQTPPRKHDLLSLSASCKILNELSIERKTFLATLSEYYIESRYPEDRASLAKMCTKEFAEKMLSETKEVLKWVESKLK